MENQSICYYCFHEVIPGTQFCDQCGHSIEQDREKYPLALPYGTVLGGRYITGYVLGQGGFGITYIAQEYKTKELVAIKEFFPETMVMRNASNTAVPFSEEQKSNFNYGKTSFLEEAQTLAQFIGNPNIVGVKSYFEENGTAYFAMEFVDGISLQTYLADHGGRLSWDETKKIMIPVMQALQAVHARGIIHRDIKPDNISIDRSGVVKLLDFGSARYSMGEKSRSLDVILTHGFAPKEQYSRHGRQGAYTDIYALAATMYYALTGRKPPDSIDRADEDDLVPPSTLGVRIPEDQENALLKALAVAPADRYQDVGSFLQALQPDAVPAAKPAEAAPARPSTNAGKGPAAKPTAVKKQPQQPPAPEKPHAPSDIGAPAPKKSKKPVLPVAIGAVVLVIVLALVLGLKSCGGSGTGGTGTSSGGQSTSDHTEPAETSTAAPQTTADEQPEDAQPTEREEIFENTDLSDAAEIAADNNLTTIQVGETTEIAIKANGYTYRSDGVTWSSDNESVATVDQNGKVTGIGAGTANISGVYEGETYTIRITVNDVEQKTEDETATDTTEAPEETADTSDSGLTRSQSDDNYALTEDDFIYTRDGETHNLRQELVDDDKEYSNLMIFYGDDEPTFEMSSGIKLGDSVNTVYATYGTVTPDVLDTGDTFYYQDDTCDMLDYCKSWIVYWLDDENLIIFGIDDWNCISWIEYAVN